MSRIKEIAQHVQEISTNTKEVTSWLYSAGKNLSIAQARISTLLEGEAGNHCDDIVAALQMAKMRINSAVLMLSDASYVAEDWVRKQTGQQVSDYGFATNSYERSLQTLEQSNVFLRQSSDLSESFLSFFPADRREAVQSSYAQANPKIIELLNKYACELRGIHGGIEGSYYSPVGQHIVMDESYNHSEYTDVLKHELGHFIDHMSGDTSLSSEFANAIAVVNNRFDTSVPEGRTLINEMMDDLFSTGAGNDRSVTDTISALFKNNEIVSNRFIQEAIIGYTANYQHGDEYWYSSDKMVPKEVFANLFAVYTDERRTSVDFLERWFPEITDAFKDGLLL